jgi:hypothetical protein
MTTTTMREDEWTASTDRRLADLERWQRESTRDEARLLHELRVLAERVARLEAERFAHAEASER